MIAALLVRHDFEPFKREILAHSADFFELKPSGLGWSDRYGPIEDKLGLCYEQLPT